MQGLIQSERVATDWRMAIPDFDMHIDKVARFLDAERESGHDFAPGPAQVLRAFEQPLEQVRVVIVGQDPYPTPGHAMGLAFSVSAKTRPLPRTLTNIFREYQSDLDLPMPGSGDLCAWSRQGVLLLNRVLTVRTSTADSHRAQGWEEFTAAAMQALIRRGGALVGVLWGQKANSFADQMAQMPVITSAHPSPLSAHRGFFGSRPFSRVNTALAAMGHDPIDWRLE